MHLCIFFIFLLFSIISIPIALSSTFLSQMGLPSQINIVFIIGLFFSPVLVSTLLAYLITARYAKVKKKFYTKPLEILREKGIRRNEDVELDFRGFMIGSMVICVSLFVILGFTSILKVINELPWLEIIPIPKEIEETVLDSSYTALILQTFVISYIGPLMMFLMRHFHHVLSIEKERFPGSRVVMGIMFSAIGVFSLAKIYEFGSGYFPVPQFETKIDETLIIIMIIASLSFSAAVWTCDRLIFSKIKK